jgi:hypothetical protein
MWRMRWWSRWRPAPPHGRSAPEHCHPRTAARARVQEGGCLDSAPPGRLTAEHRVGLDAIIARCPELAATRTLVCQFADMLTHRQGSKLPGWADQAEASDIPEIRSFAAGLRKDWPAVTAGLTCPGAPAQSKATSTASR